MPETTVMCPNCGHRLATIDFALPERAASATAPSDHPLLLRVADAARHLGVSRTSLYALIGKGDVRVIRLGRSIRVPWQELKRIAGEHG